MTFVKLYDTEEQRTAAHKANVAKWETANKERRKQYAREWYQANKAVLIEKQAAWKANNKEKIRGYDREWTKRNLPYCAEKQRRKVANIKQQTCECCSRQSVVEFYANRPAGHDVDHVIPLARGGAHCLKNMQYLTISANRRKGARLLAA